MTRTISLIVCAYNERETILTILQRIQAADYGDWEKELVIVDNCSTDGTRDLLKTVDYPNTRIIYQPQNMGKGTSIRTAIEHISGDYAVIQDADLEYHPQDVRRLLDKAEEGAIAIFGSRTKGGTAIYEYAHAYWGVRAITLTMNFLFGANLTDAATATKMVRSDVLKALNLVGKSFDLDFELPAKLRLAGITIEEVSISYNPRTYEEGKKITARDGIYAFMIMMRDRLRLSPVWKQGQRPDLQISSPQQAVK
jgi:glycosyltransferase involved in cell wall biosynthesis